MTEGHGDEIVLANELIGRLKGKQLIQFRMGYGVHLEFGSDNEVTIETSLGVVDRPTRWSGEPLTAEAAWALLPLNLSEVTLAKIGRDGALDLGFGLARLSDRRTRCTRHGKFAGLTDCSSCARPEATTSPSGSLKAKLDRAVHLGP